MTITPSSLNLDSAWSGNGWPSSRPYITIFNNDLRFDCRLELCVCDVFSLPKATVFTDAADAVVVQYIPVGINSRSTVLYIPLVYLQLLCSCRPQQAQYQQIIIDQTSSYRTERVVLMVLMVMIVLPTLFVIPVVNLKAFTSQMSISVAYKDSVLSRQHFLKSSLN
jgi:hypothetical protein